ncbi:MAG TPA: UDP-N-acetylmuramoyl-L-alanine--D-glutamate ligase [Candidatus Didemnitutus sp.]
MTPSIPAAVAALLERPVAILGAGVSGAGVQALLASIGAAGTVYDEKSDGSARNFTSRDAASYGLVVFSPGFPPEHRWLMTALDAGCVCLGELDFASLFWKGDLVAITGTNGKTTLTEFLAHALNASGQPAFATGNVGYPFSRLVIEHPVDAIAVCEVSSFQAETLIHLRPTATIWTNFAEDHLERHADLNAYFAAKWRLLDRTPSGALFVGSSVQRYGRETRRNLRSSACIETENLAPDPELAGTIFASYPQREDFVLAAAWWVRNDRPIAALHAAARTFRPGPHRLARVTEKDGVTYWNDSKATNFHAVEAALATFDAPVLWIGGGKAKGGDLAGFIRRIAHHLRHAYLIGETKPLLAAFCQSTGVPATPCATLADAVKAARAAAHPGEHVLLSPGFASFDMFRGYDDRGRQFETLVENL